MGRLLKNAGRVVPAPVLGAMEQGAAILAAANARADALIGQGEARREEARQQGYQQGYDDGRAAAAAELTQTLAAAALDAAHARAQAEPAAMRLAGRLAAKMAEKIVGRAIELAPETLTEIAAQALAACRARAGVVKLRVHPDDVAALGRDPARRELYARLEGGVELQMEGDPAVSRYGCIVETATVRLDARLETQIAVLEKAIAGEASRD